MNQSRTLQRGRYELVMRKVARVGDGDAVGVAEDPIEPLFDDLMLGQRQHQSRRAGDQRGEQRMKICARLLELLAT